MKQILLIIAMIICATSANAYQIKQAKTTGEGKNKTQTAVVQCQNFDDSLSKEVCVIRRTVLCNKTGKCDKWKKWQIVGKGGSYKKWEDGAEDCCLGKSLK